MSDELGSAERRILELDVEPETAHRFNVDGGRPWSGTVLRVRCRYAGERRWHRFLIVPDEGQDLDELAWHAEAAARAYLGERCCRILSGRRRSRRGDARTAVAPPCAARSSSARCAIS